MEQLIYWAQLSSFIIYTTIYGETKGICVILLTEIKRQWYQQHVNATCLTQIDCSNSSTDTTEQQKQLQWVKHKSIITLNIQRTLGTVIVAQKASTYRGAQ